jgi:transcriptional pleiotropic regulator of transition state genes
MKSTGIVRKIDRLGRIVIPMEVRKIFNIDSMDPLEISVEKNRIVITKFAHGCIFCGSKKNLNLFKEKKICTNCSSLIKENQ